MGLTFATKPRRRFWRWRTLFVVVIVVAIAAGAFVVFGRGDETPGLPTGEVDAFLKHWESGDTAAMAEILDAPPENFDALVTSLAKTAPGSTATYTRTSLIRLEPGEDARAGYHAKVDIPSFGTFEWDGNFNIIRTEVDDREVWRIQWRPDVLYPGLAEGERLRFTSSWPERGSILAADGSLLAGKQPVIQIGLEPGRVDDMPKVKQLLFELTGTTAEAVDAALAQPWVKPDLFVPVATVAEDERYQNEIRPALFPLRGVLFKRTEGVVTPSTTLGRQIVGSVGEITAEQLEELGPPYKAGDIVGRSGVQAAFEKLLAGMPSGQIDIVRDEEGGAKVVRTEKKFEGKPPQSVALTVDPRVQQAAEAALAGVTQNAALVAVDITTGGIRAVVSKPDGGFNRAIDGAYPPGSTFKVVTSAALLANGNAPNTPAPCPAELEINGRTFRNFEGEASTSLSLAEAFKISCNNAFIGLADQLPENALTDAAKSFGFEADWSLPLPSAGGSFPDPVDATERAAAAIGQGRVLASPAHMASVAAAVASGQWHAPSLTTQPKPDNPAVPALDANVVAALQSFMASVPQSGGTAAGAGLPPGTAGKTGTAEFGNEVPPRTHAWFIGYRGDLAFAVIVEDGGVGGRVAAPLAAAFLNALG